MPAKRASNNIIIDTKDITFKCKFCGQTKPFSEMVILRQYFPQLSACKDCSKGNLFSEQTQQPS